jgi:hypothetical protein
MRPPKRDDPRVKRRRRIVWSSVLGVLLVIVGWGIYEVETTPSSTVVAVEWKFSTQCNNASRTLYEGASYDQYFVDTGASSHDLSFKGNGNYVVGNRVVAYDGCDFQSVSVASPFTVIYSNLPVDAGPGAYFNIHVTVETPPQLIRGGTLIIDVKNVDVGCNNPAVC